jgi:hypothetical protein
MIVKPTLRTKFGQPGSKISSLGVSHEAVSAVPMCATSDKTSSGILTSSREALRRFEIYFKFVPIFHSFSV